MVKERMDLLELLRKGGMDGDMDFLREALRVVVEGIMDSEVSSRIGAEYGERSPERVTQRNGYRSRAWDTRVGTMDLHIPKLREGSYFPSLLEPRRRSERALLAVIQQAYLEGVSTRRVDDLVKALGCEGISKSQASRICQELDVVVDGFMGRPLGAGPYPYLWLDALTQKVSEDGRIVNVSVVVATTVNGEGKREIIGMDVGLGLKRTIASRRRTTERRSAPVEVVGLTSGVAADAGSATVIVMANGIDFKKWGSNYQQGAHGIITRTQSYSAEALDSKIKHQSRMNFRLAELEAADVDPNGWAIVTDTNGNISEGTGWNVFIVTDGVIRTPGDGSILQGVSRGAAVDMAGQLDIPVVEEELQPYDLYTADEAFFSSTFVCVMPVTRADNRLKTGFYEGIIVDSQVHIWQNSVPSLPHHRQIPSYTTDDLLEEMDEAGVDAAVIHPPGWDPGGDHLALEAARRHPDRLSILGKLPLDRSEGRELIDGWKQQPGMLGLRFFLQPHQQSWPDDGTMDWLWPAAERAGIPAALYLPNYLAMFGQVAERHPGLKLIVDHLGRLSGKTDDPAFENLSELLALAKHPNVAVKASGAPFYSTDPYPFRNIHGYLQQIYDAFGPERMFWGTDITKMPYSWRQCVTMLTEELAWLPEKDKELVMGRALCDWLGWELPA